MISHTHWDHIQGFPFFAPLFASGNEWHVFGPKGLDQSLRETLAGQMQYTYFPITPDQFGATIRYHDLLEGRFEIGDIRVTTQYLNHPALTLGYRLTADNASVVYCCDHEPYSPALGGGEGVIAGHDLRHAEFMRDADLLIHDAQYTAAEYPAKAGWGHSTGEYVVRLAGRVGVRRVALTHHDPMRDDASVDRIVEDLRAKAKAEGSSLLVTAATEGEIVMLEAAAGLTAAPAADRFQATTALEPELEERSVILSIADSSLAASLAEAARAEGIRPAFFSSLDEARKLVDRDRPSLAILEHDGTHVDGLALCREIRQTVAGEALPVVIVATSDDAAAGAAAGVSDWLLEPFSEGYARTKLRAWVLRTACNWIRASIPDDEEQRISALHDLKILDTAAEERFDRVTRLATALFDVPMAMISLVDANRQWYKSCLGVSRRETSRDEAFCAHVVYNREPMVIADALQDARFADNPLVTGDPRVRFYAGYPLILENGSCIGTLCLLDTRPRTFAGEELARLHDLADITLRELRAAAA
jgi:phosphoribosyl 1,2-cyclic phosphodiesterase